MITFLIVCAICYLAYKIYSIDTEVNKKLDDLRCSNDDEHLGV